ncbi:MAG: cation diffusion facilitator family transporter [Calditrichaceae bacterium]
MAHDHAHHHENKDYGKAFAIGISLNIVYIIIEIVYGIIINSLVLIADAGHNLSDVLGLLLAWAASYLVQKSATDTHTYGYKKSTILAAFMNAVILLAAIGGIVWEAAGRFGDPQTVPGQTIMIVAGIGFIVNAITALLFFSGRKEDLNIKGAFLHMAADAGISLGVFLVGFVLTFTNLYWLDPLVSIIIAIIIFWGTWGLLKDSFNLALDAIPEHIDREAVEKYLESLPEVSTFHDLHIWAMSTTETAITIHLVINQPVNQNNLIEKISDDFRHKFSIEHSTIQIENVQEKDCRQNKI